MNSSMKKIPENYFFIFLLLEKQTENIEFSNKILPPILHFSIIHITSKEPY